MSKFSIPYRFFSKKTLNLVPNFISPNFIVYFGFFIFLFFPLLLIYDQKILSIILLMFVVFLDHLDGDLARHRNETSVYGAKIDTISDRLRGFILVISIGFTYLNSNYLTSLVPLLIFILNEFIIINLRQKNENFNFVLRLVFNLDFLGWVPFSYIYPFLILLPKNYLIVFYVIASIYVLVKLSIVLVIRILKFNK